MHPGLSLLALCAAGAAAHRTTNRGLGAQTTATAAVLVASITSGLAGSVISANPCDTTYTFLCTDRELCAGRSWTYTLTKGLSTLEIQYRTSASGTKASAYEFCSMHGSYYAACTETVSLSFVGTKTVTSTTTTASGDQLTYGQFPITVGAHKLAGATGVFTASGNAAATKNAEVLKVLVAPAAAAAVAVGIIG